MTQEEIDKYYQILGVSKNSSLEEIKKAYRSKAKLLHPDRNKSSDAHESFVLLNEAFDFLQKLKTGKLYDQSKHSNSRRPTNKRTYNDWKNAEREKVREKARQYAKMQYADYLKSDHYKSVKSLSTIFTHLGFLFTIVILLVIPISSYNLYGISGLGGALLINIILSPMTIATIKEYKEFNLGELSVSFFHIIKTEGFIITIFTITNIIIALKFGLQTLVSHWILLGMYLTAMILVFLFCKSKVTPFRLKFYTLCIAPLMINFLVLINFVLSFNPIEETYKYKNSIQKTSRGRLQQSTYIYLENEAYINYFGIRAFLDYESMLGKRKITYTFREGILGLRVMTDYEFHN